MKVRVRSTLLDLVAVVDDLSGSPTETAAVVAHVLRSRRARFVGSPPDAERAARASSREEREGPRAAPCAGR